MCRIELATNTITAESRIGSHNAVIGTMRSSSENRVVTETARTGSAGQDSARAYIGLAKRVNCVCGGQSSSVGCPWLSQQGLKTTRPEGIMLQFRAAALHAQHFLNLSRNS